MAYAIYWMTVVLLYGLQIAGAVSFATIPAAVLDAAVFRSWLSGNASLAVEMLHSSSLAHDGSRAAASVPAGFSKGVATKWASVATWHGARIHANSSLADILLQSTMALRAASRPAAAVIAAQAAVAALSTSNDSAPTACEPGHPASCPQSWDDLIRAARGRTSASVAVARLAAAIGRASDPHAVLADSLQAWVGIKGLSTSASRLEQLGIMTSWEGFKHAANESCVVEALRVQSVLTEQCSGATELSSCGVSPIASGSERSRALAVHGALLLDAGLLDEAEQVLLPAALPAAAAVAEALQRGSWPMRSSIPWSAQGDALAAHLLSASLWRRGAWADSLQLQLAVLAASLEQEQGGAVASSVSSLVAGLIAPVAATDLLSNANSPQAVRMLGQLPRLMAALNEAGVDIMGRNASVQSFQAVRVPVAVVCLSLGDSFRQLGRADAARSMYDCAESRAALAVSAVAGTIPLEVMGSHSSNAVDHHHWTWPLAVSPHTPQADAVSGMYSARSRHTTAVSFADWHRLQEDTVIARDAITPKRPAVPELPVAPFRPDLSNQGTFSTQMESDSSYHAPLLASNTAYAAAGWVTSVAARLETRSSSRSSRGNDGKRLLVARGGPWAATLRLALSGRRLLAEQKRSLVTGVGSLGQPPPLGPWMRATAGWKGGVLGSKSGKRLPSTNTAHLYETAHALWWRAAGAMAASEPAQAAALLRRAERRLAMAQAPFAEMRRAANLTKASSGKPFISLERAELVLAQGTAWLQAGEPQRALALLRRGRQALDAELGQAVAMRQASAIQGTIQAGMALLRLNRWREGIHKLELAVRLARKYLGGRSSPLHAAAMGEAAIARAEAEEAALALADLCNIMNGDTVCAIQVRRAAAKRSLRRVTLAVRRWRAVGADWRSGSTDYSRLAKRHSLLTFLAFETRDLSPLEAGAMQLVGEHKEQWDTADNSLFYAVVETVALTKTGTGDVDGSMRYVEAALASLMQRVHGVMGNTNDIAKAAKEAEDQDAVKQSPAHADPQTHIPTSTASVMIAQVNKSSYQANPIPTDVVAASLARARLLGKQSRSGFVPGTWLQQNVSSIENGGTACHSAMASVRLLDTNQPLPSGEMEQLARIACTTHTQTKSENSVCYAEALRRLGAAKATQSGILAVGDNPARPQGTQTPIISPVVAGAISRADSACNAAANATLNELAIAVRKRSKAAGGAPFCHSVRVMDAQALYVLLQLRADDVRGAGGIPSDLSAFDPLAIAAVPSGADAAGLSTSEAFSTGGDHHSAANVDTRPAPSLVAALATAVMEGRVLVPDGAPNAPSLLPVEITNHESAAYEAWTTWIAAVSGINNAFGLQ